MCTPSSPPVQMYAKSKKKRGGGGGGGRERGYLIANFCVLDASEPSSVLREDV